MQEQQMKNRDQRTRLMSELLANIRSYVLFTHSVEGSLSDRFLSNRIKLYAWENAFIRKVLAVRNDKELKMLKKIGVVTVSVPTTQSG